jgi:hypothetical protein
MELQPKRCLLKPLQEGAPQVFRQGSIATRSQIMLYLFFNRRRENSITTDARIHRTHLNAELFQQPSCLYGRFVSGRAHPRMLFIVWKCELPS